MGHTRIHQMRRREFLARASALGVAPFLGAPRPAAAEPPPEITKLRLVHSPAICIAPQYLAQALLGAEGFTEVEYVEIPSTTPHRAIASGKADLSMDLVWSVVMGIDAGDPLSVVAGVHPGCYELFGTARVRAIKDLRGKTVPVSAMGSSEHNLLASMAGYVGLDPAKDIDWIVRPPAEAMQLLAEDKVDAFLGFPPEPQALRARGVGRVIVDTAIDKPWSQYFCCVLVGNRQFLDKYPIAAKRTVRAVLKGADLCAHEPEQAARFVADRGFASRYEYALDAMKKIPYDAWRTRNPEDTLRFAALRLHDAGLIKSTPEKIIARGADWRFLNQLKKELKA